ncbi:MAG: hypothetical protein AB1486_10235 [Planctomycetota bacterium]
MLPLVLTVCLVIPALTPPDGEGSPAELVTKRYVLAALQGLVAEDGPGAKTLPLLPMPMLPFGSTRGLPESEGLGVDLEELVEAVRQGVRPEEWEYAGRSIEVVDNSLLVTAPADLHVEIAAFLTSLVHLLMTPLRVTIDLYETSALVESRIGVSEADADSWLRQHCEAGELVPLRSFTLNALPGHWASRGLTRTVSYAADWSVEIAEQAVCGDPVMETLALGTQLLLKASKTPSCTQLTIGLLHADLAAPIEERRLDSRSRLATDSAELRQQLDWRAQLPAVRFASLATTMALKEGQVALLQVGTAPLVQGQSMMAVVRAVGHPPFFANLGAYCAAELGFFGTADEVPLVPEQGEALPTWMGEGFADGPGWWLASLVPGPAMPYSLIGLLGQQIEIHDIRRVGPYLLLPVEKRDAVVSLVKTWHEPQAIDPTLEVSLRSREATAPTAPGSEVARFTIPMVPGFEAAAFFGVQKACVQDWDVDVANNAAVANPMIGNLLQGGFVKAVLSRSGTDEIVLRVTALLSLLDENTPWFDLGNDIAGSVQLPQALTGRLDTAVCVPLDKNGCSAPFPLGTLAVEGDTAYDLVARVLGAR